MPKRKPPARTNAHQGHGSINIQTRAGRHRWRFFHAGKLLASGTADNAADAQAAAANARTDHLRGTLHRLETITVREYTERWLKRRASLESSTQRNYARLLELGLEHIGSLRMRDVRQHHIRDLLASVAARESTNGLGRGRTTASGTLAALLTRLRSVFTEAQGDGVIQILPTATVKNVRKQRTEHPGVALDDKQFSRFLLIGQTLHDLGKARLWPALQICASIGLRRSEVMGLEWQHINLETLTLFVRQTLIGVPGAIELHEMTKTDSGRRDIPIPPGLARVLEAHQATAKTNAAAMGQKWTSSLPVFQTIELAWTHPDNLNRAVVELLRWSDPTARPRTRPTDAPDLDDAENLRRRLLCVSGTARDKLEAAILAGDALPTISPHDLRHTAATRMRQAGMDVELLSRILGHSDIVQTLRTYRHVGVNEIRNKMPDLLAPDTKKPKTTMRPKRDQTKKTRSRSKA